MARLWGVGHAKDDVLYQKALKKKAAAKKRAAAKKKK